MLNVYIDREKFYERKQKQNIVHVGTWKKFINEDQFYVEIFLPLCLIYVLKCLQFDNSQHSLKVSACLFFFSKQIYFTEEEIKIQLKLI